MKATKRICHGLYKMGEFYISACRMEVETIWNIYFDENCTDEYLIGFITKRDAVDYLREHHYPSPKKVKRVYEVNGFYIKSHYDSEGVLWNIYKDKDCTEKYAIGFNTKRDAVTYLQ